MSNSIITDKMRAMVGVDSEPLAYEIEKGAIKKFAEAIEDPNPLWQDEDFARKTRYSSIIAPPTFITSLRAFDALSRFLAESPVKRIINGGNEIEYFQPVKVGDKIAVTQRIADLREREGKLGRTVIITLEATFRNQKGEVAAKARTAILAY